jgi:hypothetical protein
VVVAKANEEPSRGSRVIDLSLPSVGIETHCGQQRPGKLVGAAVVEVASLRLPGVCVVSVELQLGV